MTKRAHPKELTDLITWIAEEHLESFVLFGYTQEGKRMVIADTPTEKDRDALVCLLCETGPAEADTQAKAQPPDNGAQNKSPTDELLGRIGMRLECFSLGKKAAIFCSALPHGMDEKQQEYSSRRKARSSTAQSQTGMLL